MENTIRRSEMLNNENIYNVENTNCKFKNMLYAVMILEMGYTEPLKTKPF